MTGSRECECAQCQAKVGAALVCIALAFGVVVVGVAFLLMMAAGKL